MKKIELFKTQAGWMADFIGDQEILSLFGQSIVPTAFTSNADSTTVLITIKKLNPHCSVTLKGENK